MKTVKKALDILDLFLGDKKSLSLSEIANDSGFNVSSVHSILSDFVEKKYLSQSHKRGNYSLGYKYFEFTTIIHESLGLREVAYPYMEELCRLVNENVTLAVLENDQAAIQIEMIISNNTLNVIGKPESRLSLYDSGIGKALLAFQPEEKWEIFKAKGMLQPKTANTITSYKKLKAHLQKIREEGIAIDDQEVEIGVCNIATPLRDFSGKVVAAVGLLGPSIRIHEKRMDELGKALKQCASKISKALGYTDHPR